MENKPDQNKINRVKSKFQNETNGSDNSTVLNDNQSSLLNLQQEVDHWINTTGVRYFSELTNLSNLIEEVGEVARLIGREYGEQSFKKGEKPECIKTAIADELSDVLFIVVCLANQLDINLDEAFAKNMDKKTNRDVSRHKNNSKLKQRKESWK
jgi:NTP pyrophosphatase (non-canonical NTP hydrolase)